MSATMNQARRNHRKQAGEYVLNVFGPQSGPTPPPVSRPSKKKSTAQPRPTILVQPKGLGPIHNPNENDVLSGRGGRINAHPGNVQYRQLVLQKREEYLDERTKKLEKAHIAAQIVYVIRSMNPPGRFLKEEADGSWWDIGDQKAIKKAGQALREDTARDGEEQQTPKKSPKATSVPATSPEKTTSMVPPPVTLSRGGSSTKTKLVAQPNIYPPQVAQQPAQGFTPRPAGAFSESAAAAVSEYDPHGFQVPRVPRKMDVVFGREYLPPVDSSMLSGSSFDRAMSGVSGSEISGLTEPFSALSGSNMEVNRYREPPAQAAPSGLSRMRKLGERIEIDDGMSWNANNSVLVPEGTTSHHPAGSTDVASLDFQSLMSEDMELRRHSQQYMDDLTTLSGQMDGISLGASSAGLSSTLFDI